MGLELLPRAHLWGQFSGHPPWSRPIRPPEAGPRCRWRLRV